MRTLAFILALLVSGAATADVLTPVSSYVLTGVTGPGSEATDVKVSAAIGGEPNARLPVTVRLVCTANCFVAVSHAFTTVATSVPVYLPLGVPAEIKVNQGDTIIAVQATATGTLYITEMSK